MYIGITPSALGIFDVSEMLVYLVTTTKQEDWEFMADFSFSIAPVTEAESLRSLCVPLASLSPCI